MTQLGMVRMTVDDTITVVPDQVFLRWSDDGGCSWSNRVGQPIGKRGEYDVDVQFRRLGQARSKVFELSWSTESGTSLVGAFVRAQVGNF